MAHIVRFEISQRRIGKSAIVFKVTKGGDLMGTLEVSKGG